MKIGDLWVKLGLKKDEFDKGMKEAGEQVSGSGGLLGKIKTLKVGALAAWTAMGSAVTKFAKDAISMTQKWGDAWNTTMAGIKGAYSTFVRQISSGEGWNNLFANMREAYRVSKEVAAALDEIFERKTSFSYQEAEADKYIAEQEKIRRDASKSEKEREKAANNIIAKTEELANLKRKIYADEAAAYRKDFKRATGLQNDEEIDFLVKQYNLNRDIINQARDYLNQKKQLGQESLYAAGSTFAMGGSADYMYAGQKKGEANAALEQLERDTPQAIKDVAELTKKYDKANDDLVKNMAEADVAVIRIDTDMLRAQQRANTFLGSIAGGGGGDALAEQAARVAQRAEDAAKAEIDILNEKYDQEKALLERYGYDTEALLQEYLENVADLLIDEIQQTLDDIDDIEPVVFEPLEIETPDMTEWNKFYTKFKEDQERMQELLSEFRDASIQGFSDAVQELADQFAGLEEINPGKVVQALLTPLADMAIKEGEILIAQGVGVEACKKALESLNGYAAIVAGTALVAIGAAAKSGLAALAKSGAGTTATTSYASSGSSAGQQTIQTEMTIRVEGVLRGSDIYLAGQKAVNNWSR